MDLNHMDNVKNQFQSVECICPFLWQPKAIKGSSSQETQLKCASMTQLDI